MTQASPTAALADDPYAPPAETAAGIDPIVGRVWRVGKVLHMDKRASLPPRCVRCNAPAETQLHRKMYWHSPWWALTIFAGLLAYAIIALVVRKRADVDLGLCALHARARTRTIVIAWVLPLLAWALCFVLPEGFVGLGIMLALSTTLAAIVVGQRRAAVLRPLRIDEREARLVGAGPSFLATIDERPK